MTLIIFAFWIYRSIRLSEYEKLDVRLQSLAEEVQSEIEEEINNGLFPDSLDLGTVKVEGLPPALKQIFDTTGKLVVGNSILAQLRQPDWKTENISKSYFRDLKIENTGYRYYWCPVEVNDKYPYFLQIAVPISDINSSLRHLKILLLVSIPLTILISAFAVYLITTLAFRPLSTMAVTAERISAINLDQRLLVPHIKNELYTLSMTLNQMFERLESAFQNQRQFVADASHEIRTPLTIMNIELEYARKVASDPEVLKSIDSCLEEIGRLSRMTDSLLLLARLDNASLTTKKRVFRLDELVIEIAQDMMKLAQDKSIKLELYIESAIELSSDSDHIRQALINIIDNAIKYSPPGSKVGISLRSPVAPGNLAEISIKDSGAGISDTDIKKIFKRFFRGENTREAGNGSGLGLPIAQELISFLGGSVDLKSNLGIGTEVKIILPLG
jgi:signal transduction histidine kinase